MPTERMNVIFAGALVFLMSGLQFLTPISYSHAIANGEMVQQATGTYSHAIANGETVQQATGTGEDLLNQILILNNTNIDVNKAKLFTVGDFNGDGIQDLITFHAITSGIKSRLEILLYHKIGDEWEPCDIPYYVDVDGSVFVAKAGNFDIDPDAEVALGCYLGDNCTGVFVLDFDKTASKYNLQLVYKCNYSISDLDITPIHDGLNDIAILINVIDPCLLKITSEIWFLKVSHGSFSPELIHSEENDTWNLLTVGHFAPWSQSEFEIGLYKYEYFNTPDERSWVKLVNSSGGDITSSILLEKSRRARDVVAWDSNGDGIDELTLLESELDSSGQYFNQLTLYNFISSNTTFFVWKNFALPCNELMKVAGVGNLDNARKRLIILDAPSAGSVRVLFAIDDEASVWFGLDVQEGLPSFAAFLYVIDLAIFYVFWIILVGIYYFNFDIDVVLAGVITYESDDSLDTFDELWYDLQVKIPISTLRSHYADVCIADIFNPRDIGDWGYGGWGPEGGGRYAAICTLNPTIAAHELGHCYGLICTDIFCIQCDTYLFQVVYCQKCKDAIDPNNFNPEDTGYTLPSTGFASIDALFGEIPDTTSPRGGSVTTSHTLSNLNNKPTTFSIEVAGLSSDYYSIPTSTITLGPYKTVTVPITFHPPADAPMGDHSYQLRASSSTKETSGYSAWTLTSPWTRSSSASGTRPARAWGVSPSTRSGSRGTRPTPSGKTWW